jgi:hypothetical protein
MSRVIPLAVWVILAGCWKLEMAEIQQTLLPFEPAEPGPADWLVLSVDLPLECPDGSTASLLAVYPNNVDDSSPPLPTAVLFHGGAFDFVLAPDAESPLSGTHFSDPSRLASDWSFRAAFTLLGMYPNEASDEVHTGIIAARLAERGIAMLVPTNCWGDLWHNVRGQSENDFTQDFFFRDGRAAAEWATKIATTPGFAEAIGIDLPFTPSPDQVYLLGFGEGGRAVSEMLALDGNQDGVADIAPKGVLLDSTPDDLRVYFDDPSAYGNHIGGLNRIFPDGVDDVVNGALFHLSELPPRVVYVYGLNDPKVPSETHLAALDRLEEASGSTTWSHAEVSDGHIHLNGRDPLLTVSALDILLGNLDTNP